MRSAWWSPERLICQPDEAESIKWPPAVQIEGRPPPAAPPADKSSTGRPGSRAKLVPPSKPGKDLPGPADPEVRELWGFCLRWFLSLPAWTMSAVKSGSSLRSLVLTPERIPSFLIPSRSPRLQRCRSDRTRLLSDLDEDTVDPASPRGFLLRVPSPRLRPPRRAAAAAPAAAADTDLTTRAAMSLHHVDKVTTPYGFRAVLAASPCTRRRESLFHKSKPASRHPPQEPAGPGDPDAGPGDPDASPACGRAPMGRLKPVKAFGLQVMEELKKPAAALKARSPAVGRTR